MIYEPHDYQKYATGYIESHPIAAVLLDMGLGKTSITLTALNDLLFDSFEVHKVLVVAPLRVARFTWSAEIEKWEHLSGLQYSVAVGTEKERLEALQRQADIYIINRENVQWLIEKSGIPFDFDMVVIDELSSFKNHQATLRHVFCPLDPVRGDDHETRIPLKASDHGQAYHLAVYQYRDQLHEPGEPPVE